MWDRVYAVYTGGQFDLAVEGFQSYHPDVPDLAAGRRCAAVHRPLAVQRRQVPEAATALQRVISNYPQSDSVPPAYYKLGLDVRGDEAVRAGAPGVRDRDQELPEGVEATLAQQSLVRVQDKK